MNTAPQITYAQPDDPFLKKILIKGVETITGKPKLQRAYSQARQAMLSRSVSFWEAAIQAMHLQLEFDAQALEAIPKKGPLVMVANHPFGVLDGITLCYLASTIRPSFKILINSVLCQTEEFKPHFLPIDFRETKEAISTNIHSKNAAIEELKKEGAVLIFPAGGVSTAASAFSSNITDSEWKTFTAKLIKQSGATVVPLYFHGTNSRIFQVVSHISLTLRLSLLLHEVKNKMGSSLQVEIGRPISPEEIASIGNRQQIMHFLREQTYQLAKVD